MKIGIEDILQYEESPFVFSNEFYIELEKDVKEWCESITKILRGGEEA